MDAGGLLYPPARPLGRIGVVFFGLVGLVSGALLLSALVWVPPIRYAPLWRPFALTYSIWEIDEVSGAVRADQTRRLVVRSLKPESLSIHK